MPPETPAESVILGLSGNAMPATKFSLFVFGGMDLTARPATLRVPHQPGTPR